ncbi:hypothetical protein [Caproiciproducens sp. MSJ-32]|uniref:hypothetical protein n=1 Tax=Caproiciproducens sp. MSJ-32 TaxID=2841527 RepID=UPI001C123742|nr:hypothetical protein [Caproiciproducens sp. MSJ-32]MBU5454259.1 hypothetical protein [Caproiciproducens sp. MSJ-32]
MGRGRKKRINYTNTNAENEAFVEEFISEEKLDEVSEETILDDKIKNGISKVDEIVSSLNNIQNEFSSFYRSIIEEDIRRCTNDCIFEENCNED